MTARPVRRALLDRPQRLGFLPTFWFWNDRERQRLVTPLLVTIAFPVTALFFLMAWLELPVGLLVVFGTVWPQLVLGLVERRVRRELRRRALDGAEELLAPAAPQTPAAPQQAGDPALLWLAGFGAGGALLAVAATWGAGAALAVGVAMGLVAGVTGAHLAGRHRTALGSGSSKPGGLPPSPCDTELAARPRRADDDDADGGGAGDPPALRVRGTRAVITMTADRRPAP